MAKSVTLWFCVGVAFIRASFAQDCITPTVSNGDFAGDLTEGGTAAILCHNGYTGGGAATCSGGTWTILPGCSPRDCGTTTVANGNLLGDTFYGGTANVICNAGYEGGGTATCGATGTWTSVPGCTAKDCGPPSVNHGSIQGDTTFGGSPFIQCDTGYTGGGTGLTCLDTGVWDIQTACNPRSCEISTVVNGVLSGDNFYTGTASVVCNAGYEGGGTATCQSNGQWATLPTCSPKDCGIPTIPHGTLSATSSTLYGGTATVECDSGYTGGGSFTCLDSGNWGTIPACNPVETADCGNLPSPSNGAVTFPGATTYGEIAQYSCDPGYNLVGVATRTCQADSSWSDNDPTCEIKDCGPVTPPTNGAVVYSNNGATTVQETATFTCNAGYNLVGDTTRTCDVTGTWGGATPVCNVKDCGVLTNPINGVVTTSSGTTYGQTAVYTCSPEYGLSGNSQRHCQADGTWDGAAPACILADCPNLASPTHGTVSIDSTNFNGIANYTCDAGYILIGNQIRTCQSEGAWTGTAPSCQILDCGNPSTTGYIYSSVTTTTSGSSANVACATGYEGTATPDIVTCLDTGLWESVTGCNIIIPTAPIGYTAPSYTTLTYESTASVSCDTGYTGSPADIVCQAVKTWSTPTGCAIAGSQNAASLARSILATRKGPGIYPLSKVVLLLALQYIALV